MSNKPLNEEEQALHDRSLHNFAVMPGWNITCNRKVANALVNHDWCFCQGDIREIRCESIGAGVYKVFTKAKVYND